MAVSGHFCLSIDVAMFIPGLLVKVNSVSAIVLEMPGLPPRARADCERSGRYARLRLVPAAHFSTGRGKGGRRRPFPFLILFLPSRTRVSGGGESVSVTHRRTSVSKLIERGEGSECPLARLPTTPPACRARAYIRRACWVRGFCVFTARTQTS